ncbi:MAG: hypothetical protein HYX84_03870 [Chloroflexi bacterium]|nr:hypothetical protein [Chloroflexota bacterium]
MYLTLHGRRLYPSIWPLYNLPQELEKRRIELEMERQYGPKHDPQGPPPKRPGDKYVLIGLVVGVVIGGVLGILLARLVPFVSVAVGLIAGAIAGGIVGVMVADKLKDRLLNRRRRTGHTG